MERSRFGRKERRASEEDEASPAIVSTPFHVSKPQSVLKLGDETFNGPACPHCDSQNSTVIYLTPLTRKCMRCGKMFESKE